MPHEYLRDYFLTWHAAMVEARHLAHRTGRRQRVQRIPDPDHVAGTRLRVWLVSEAVAPCS